jgi:hypothetical protein
MISFEDLFLQSRGKPVVYNGKSLVMKDDFPCEGCRNFRLTIESAAADWKQGVLLRVDGRFEINEKRIDRSVVLWQSTAPDAVDISVQSNAPSIEVRNVWDVGDGVMHSWHNGAAMIIEPIENGRRYFCNDGRADDDFDDIVFRLERGASLRGPDSRTA